MFKKNKDLFKFIGIIAIILLLLVGLYTIYGGMFANLLYNALFYGKYNTMLISEIVIVLFAIIVMNIMAILFQEQEAGFFQKTKKTKS